MTLHSHWSVAPSATAAAAVVRAIYVWSKPHLQLTFSLQEMFWRSSACRLCTQGSLHCVLSHDIALVSTSLAVHMHCTSWVCLTSAHHIRHTGYSQLSAAQLMLDTSLASLHWKLWKNHAPILPVLALDMSSMYAHTYVTCVHTSEVHL